MLQKDTDQALQETLFTLIQSASFLSEDEKKSG
jgi:hypothetical protein